MAPLIRIAAACTMMSSPVQVVAEQVRQPHLSGSAVERWHPFIAEAAQRFNVPQAWIGAVMKAESGGRTHLGGRLIVSHAGAMGLMQLMPGTWAAMRARHGLGSDPHDPRDNILAGTAYLRAMYDSFGYPGLFAAYNAGPGRYSDYLRTGRALPLETRTYIDQLAKTSASPSMPPAILSGSRLFFALGSTAHPAGGDKAAVDRSALIVPLEPVEEAQK